MSLTIVTVPLDQLEQMIDNAVAKALATRRVEGQQGEQVVSLDRAAKLLHRRRADVLAMVRSGRIPAERAGTDRKPIWRVRVADLRKAAP